MIPVTAVRAYWEAELRSAWRLRRRLQSKFPGTAKACKPWVCFCIRMLRRIR